MAEQTSIYSLIRFNAWMDDYGTQKAGLPTGALTLLHESSAGLQARAMGLRSNLQRVKDSWQTVKDDYLNKDNGDSKALKAIINYVVVELYNMKVTAGTMRDDSAKMKVQLINAQSLVQGHVIADKAKLGQLALDLAQASRRLELARINLTNAKAELNGWKGFWNGFVTGLTFGAYNPVQANIRKANEAVAGSYNELNRITGLRDQQNRYQGMQVECKGLLEKLDGVDVTLTDLQNALNTAFSMISEAHKAEAQYLNATTKTVANYYFNAGAGYMDKLFGWMASFFGATGSTPLAPAGILPAILGTFETRAYDRLHLKNDWHYVTVFKLSTQSAMWSNRAGVSWVLSLTPDKNMLAIGSDCPYYKDYKEAKVIWNGNVVTGITGPDKTVYERT